MIVFLKGKLVHKEPTFAVIDVNGVGYHVNISLNTFAEIKDKEDILLSTYLQVREDAHILYGFSNEAEKAMKNVSIFPHLEVGGQQDILLIFYFGKSI